MNKTDKINQIIEIINNLKKYNIHDLHQICQEKDIYNGKEAGFRAFCKKYNIPINKKSDDITLQSFDEKEHVKEISIDKLQPSLPIDMICDCCKQKKPYIIAKKKDSDWEWKYCYYCHSNLQHMNTI